MGNENSSNPETPRFFWRSDDDPFSPKSEIIWCPFDRTSSDFLEYEYQSFLKDKTRPPPEINGYIYRFDCWHQIKQNETYKQRPLLRFSRMNSSKFTSKVQIVKKFIFFKIDANGAFSMNFSDYVKALKDEIHNLETMQISKPE